MKKLRFLAFAVIALLAVVMTTNTVAQTITEKELKEEIKLLNDECPSDMGDGMIMTSASYADGKIVFKILADEDDSTIQFIGLMADTLESAMMSEFKEDEGMRIIFEYCKENKVNFIMTFYNKNGKTAELVFHHENM